MDIHALKRNGMSISEIARGTGRDRMTIRTYLTGEQVVGKRQRTLDTFDAYVRARLIEDPHVLATGPSSRVVGQYLQIMKAVPVIRIEVPPVQKADYHVATPAQREHYRVTKSPEHHYHKTLFSKLDAGQPISARIDMNSGQ